MLIKQRGVNKKYIPWGNSLKSVIWLSQCFITREFLPLFNQIACFLLHLTQAVQLTVFECNFLGKERETQTKAQTNWKETIERKAELCKQSIQCEEAKRGQCIQ